MNLVLQHFNISLHPDGYIYAALRYNHRYAAREPWAEMAFNEGVMEMHWTENPILRKTDLKVGPIPT